MTSRIGADTRREGIERRGTTIQERLAEELMMAAMRAVELIIRAQREDGSHRPALLADRGMRRAVHEPFARKQQHGLLEASHRVQQAEHGTQPCWIEFGPVGNLGGERRAPHGWSQEFFSGQAVALPR